MTLLIEKALPSDATKIVPLIMEAYGPEANYICCTNDLALVKERLINAFSLNVLTSYHHFFVIREGEKLMGAVSCAPGSMIRSMNNNLANYLVSIDQSSQAATVADELRQVQEAYDNEYYLDVLATDAQHRGKGLASLLINCVVEQAQKEGFDRVLLYAKDNLVPFYEKHSFAFYEKVLFGGKEYNRMCRKW